MPSPRINTTHTPGHVSPSSSPRTPTTPTPSSPSQTHHTPSAPPPNAPVETTGHSGFHQTSTPPPTHQPSLDGSSHHAPSTPAQHGSEPNLFQQELQRKKDARNQAAAAEIGQRDKTQAAADRPKLEQHIGKKAQEHQTLDQNWNMNAEGRNQGLVHLVDYSHARPSMVDSDAKQNPKLKFTDEQKSKLNQGPMTKEQWNQHLGSDPAFKPLQDDLNKGKSRYFTELKSEKTGLPLGADHHNPEAARQEITDLNKQKADLGKQVGELNKQLKQTKDPEAQKQLQQQLEQTKQQKSGVEAKLEGMSKYTLAQDESKAGRLGQIAQATNSGDLKGNEIMGGTQAVKQHFQDKPFNDFKRTPPRDRTDWAKVETSPARWSPNQTIPAEQSKPTAAGTKESGGLKTAHWGVMDGTEQATGPQPTATENSNLKLSTVMGGATEKKK